MISGNLTFIMTMSWTARELAYFFSKTVTQACLFFGREKSPGCPSQIHKCEEDLTGLGQKGRYIIGFFVAKQRYSSQYSLIYPSDQVVVLRESSVIYVPSDDGLYKAIPKQWRMCV